MMKRVLLGLLFFCFAYASENPETLVLNANVTALYASENKLFVGLDNGELEIYEQNGTKSASIVLPKIKNYFESDASARILSIDEFDGAIMILSQADFGGKNISIFKDGKLSTQKIAFESAKEAFFTKDSHILLALTSADIVLLDKNFKDIKHFQFSHSTLNDAAINEQRTQIVAGFESGEVKIFDLEKWKLQKIYDNHKDSVYSVDFKKGNILSCSTDRKVVFVDTMGVSKALEQDFLIYACSLDKNAHIAFSDTLKSALFLYDKDFKSLQTWNDLKFSVEGIVFLGEKILVWGYNNTINFYHIGENK